MFCGNCGAQNTDDAVFCKNCGNPLQTALQQTTGTAGSAPGTIKRNQIIGIAVGAAAALILIIVVIALSTGRSYQSTVKQFVNATFSADGEKIVEVMFPDSIVKQLVKEGSYDSRKEIVEELNSQLQRQINALNSFWSDDWKVSVKVIGAENLSFDELSDLREDYKDYNVKIKAAKIVKVELTIKVAGNTVTQEMEIPVIKIGGSWYIDFENAGNIL